MDQLSSCDGLAEGMRPWGKTGSLVALKRTPKVDLSMKEEDTAEVL